MTTPQELPELTPKELMTIAEIHHEFQLKVLDAERERDVCLMEVYNDIRKRQSEDELAARKSEAQS